MIGRLRVLLHLDSAICLVGGAAVTAFASPFAEDLDIDSTVAVRSVGMFLVGYGIVLALLARATPHAVEVSGRLTALADASWLLATVSLVGADAFSFGGDIIMAMAAIPVVALGVGKAMALRSPTPDSGRGPQAHHVGAV